MPKYLKNIKETVSAYLLEKNWSERELAKRSSLSPTTINEFLESQDRDIKVESLGAIAEAMGMHLHYLIMSPEERALWDAKAAQNDPKARLQEMVGRLPPELQEMGLAALDAIVQSHARKSQSVKKKA